MVARYVRQLAIAEQRDAPITTLSEVRQMEDRLGLSPMAMLRLRWEIVADEVAEQRQGSEPAAESARERMRAVR